MQSGIDSSLMEFVVLLDILVQFLCRSDMYLSVEVASRKVGRV